MLDTTTLDGITDGIILDGTMVGITGVGEDGTTMTLFSTTETDWHGEITDGETDVSETIGGITKDSEMDFMQIITILTTETQEMYPTGEEEVEVLGQEIRPHTETEDLMQELPTEQVLFRVQLLLTEDKQLELL